MSSAGHNEMKPEYVGRTRSIPWLLMPWILASIRHCCPWYWQCADSINGSCLPWGLISTTCAISVATNDWNWRNIFMLLQTGLDIRHLTYMPVGHRVLKIYVPCKNFLMPNQYLYKPCKLMYTAGKISTHPDWKITCPVARVTRKVYVPWDKIYMPQGMP